MASRKRHSEGIALLSMYNDDEEDEEMDDVEEPQQREHHHDDDREQSNEVERELLSNDAAAAAGELRDEEKDKVNSLTLPVPAQLDGYSSLRPLSPQHEQRGGEEAARKRSVRGRGRNRGRLTIVDYAHDEAAMSPEQEEGEFYEDEDDNADDLQEKSTPGTVQVLTPTTHSSELLEVSQADEMNSAIVELEGVEIEGVGNVDGESVDPLDKFLPPPPKEKCPEELQRKIDKFLALKKTGRSFNSEVRNRKDYRNPDFLLHAVRYQDIDQIGSCFTKDVFDPHGYDPSDFCTEIEIAMRRERERKEQELKKNPKVEFVSVGVQPAGAHLPKFSVPIPVVPGSGLPPAPEAVSRDGRPNKKSKWDKVDTDVRNPLPAGDSLAAHTAHAAQLSAANTGYSAFAQQKRREAEDKRSIERKLDRRS